jgi:hypothetical protein
MTLLEQVLTELAAIFVFGALKELYWNPTYRMSI